MKKALISSVILLIFILSFSVIASANTVRVNDDRGENSRLSDEEIASADSALAIAEERSGYSIYVYITDGGFIDSGSEEFVLNYLGVSRDDNAVILHIIKFYDEVEYGIYTFGTADELSDATIDRILDTDDVYDNLKEGRLADGITAFARAVPKEKAQFEKNSFIAVTVVSIVVALIAAGAAVGIIIYKYKKKLKSPAYPLSKFANMNLESSSDVFLDSTVTKTKVQSSSGRSGRSSGGGGFRGKR